MEKRYAHIMEQWFLMEPPLFQVLCLHELTANTNMACPLRCGRKRLEYNPLIVDEMSDSALEEAMRAEAVRILMKHPYERRPEGCSQRAMGLGSNLVIGDNYSHPQFRIETPEEMGLKKGMNYECGTPEKSKACQIMVAEVKMKQMKGRPVEEIRGKATRARARETGTVILRNCGMKTISRPSRSMK